MSDSAADIRRLAEDMDRAMKVAPVMLRGVTRAIERSQRLEVTEAILTDLIAELREQRARLKGYLNDD